MYRQHRIAIVLPMLNEADSICEVLSSLQALKNEAGQPVADQIIVCDNGSDDGSPQLALAAGVTVVFEPRRGYGAACLKAMDALDKPDIVVFVDADRSVQAEETVLLLDALIGDQHDCRNDLVIGSRTMGVAEAKSLAPAQRFGNRLASLMIQRLWQHPVSDLGPFRAIRYQELMQLKMTDKRYGWTVEMQVKAIQQKLRIKEVPVSTRRRIGQSKISGTLLGTLGASSGIIGMILKLYLLANFNHQLTKVSTAE